MFLQKRCHVRPGDSACRERRRARSRWYFSVPKGVLDVLGVDGKTWVARLVAGHLASLALGNESGRFVQRIAPRRHRPFFKTLQNYPVGGRSKFTWARNKCRCCTGVMSSLTSSSRCSSVPSASVARSSSSSRLTRKFQPLSS